MNDYILEVCVDSAESALAAAKGGASRLELCQNLVIGGTTPSPKLFEVIRRQTTIPIHALIRPRFGDFCYTPYELEEIREEVAMYRELGAEGVVVGVLKEDGTMNMAAMEQLMEAADGMSVTLHRAFDVCRDPNAFHHRRYGRRYGHGRFSRYRQARAGNENSHRSRGNASVLFRRQEKNGLRACRRGRTPQVCGFHHRDSQR